MGSSVKKAMIYILLDESGSMSGLRGDVIGSINNFIAEQKKFPDPAVIAIGVFSSAIPGMIKLIRPMVDLKEIKDLAEVDYVPNGGTPLLDATGVSIQSLDGDWKRENPDRAIFVTFTDGHENASHEFTRPKIKKLIEAREKSGLWNFIFLGANIDSFSESASMGYTVSKTANYRASSRGLGSTVHTLNSTVGTLRAASSHAFAASASGKLDVGLGGDIAEDGTLSKPTTPHWDTLQQAGVHVPAGGPPGTPPKSSMQPESWTPPTSSALFDPKLDAWKPPV